MREDQQEIEGLAQKYGLQKVGYNSWEAPGIRLRHNGFCSAAIQTTIRSYHGACTKLSVEEILSQPRVLDFIWTEELDLDREESILYYVPTKNIRRSSELANLFLSLRSRYPQHKYRIVFSMPLYFVGPPVPGVGCVGHSSRPHRYVMNTVGGIASFISTDRCNVHSLCYPIIGTEVAKVLDELELESVEQLDRCWLNAELV